MRRFLAGPVILALLGAAAFILLRVGSTDRRGDERPDAAAAQNLVASPRDTKQRPGASGHAPERRDPSLDGGWPQLVQPPAVTTERGDAGVIGLTGARIGTDGGQAFEHGGPPQRGLGDDEELAATERDAPAKKRDPISIDGGAPAYAVVINELMARNRSTLVDEKGKFEDWIELHNPTMTEVSLAGFGLTDAALGFGNVLLFTEGVTLPPGGYLVVFADGKAAQGPLHAPFKLAAEGDAVMLMTPGGVMLDEVVFGAQPGDVSFGRWPNAYGPFGLLRAPTPGRPNSGFEEPDAGVTTDAGADPDGGRPIAQGVVLNEALANNTNGLRDEHGEREDWIEILNTSDRPQDLSRHRLSDDETAADKWTFPEGTVLEPGARLVIFADNEPEQGPLHARFKLKVDGETILLTAPDGEPLDTLTLPPLRPNISFGRFPDGVGFSVELEPTPGAPNREAMHDGGMNLDAGAFDSAEPVPDAGTRDAGSKDRRDAGDSRDAGGPPPRIVINEFVAINTSGLADEANEHEDWLELYNAGTEAVELGGWFLSDDPNQPRQSPLPSGVAIPPGGFVVIFVDNEADGPLHASFKISGQGERLLLTSPDGRVVQDVAFGVQQPDVSEGRFPDGEGPIVPLATPTPGAANVR